MEARQDCQTHGKRLHSDSGGNQAHYASPHSLVFEHEGNVLAVPR